MNIKKLSKNGPNVSVMGFGCMGLSTAYGKPVSFKIAKEIIENSITLGVNFFDTADIYGDNEVLLGEILEKFPREKYVVGTKCGLVLDKKTGKKIKTDNSPEYILSCCERSLSRLKVPYIDIFYLHRIANNGKDISASMKAMATLLQKEKICHVGLSEPIPTIIEQANTALLEHTNGVHQLTAVQTEYSLLSRVPEVDGTLDTCHKLGIGFVAYAPLCRGLLAGKLDVNALKIDDFRCLIPRFSKKNMQHNRELILKISQLAKEKNCSVAQLALAWLLNKKQMIVPIPSTQHITRLKENAESVNITISKEDEKTLDAIAPIGAVSGERYWDEEMQEYALMTDIAAKHIRVLTTIV